MALRSSVTELWRAERLSVDERDEALQSLDDVDVVAIDAPLLPPNTVETLPRECERVFSRGMFQKRCKPGMSHIRGTGQTLREHGSRAATQLITANAMRVAEQSLPHQLFGGDIIEAFPNAFLGVVVPDEEFLHAQKIKRGGKFDWLYNCWIARGLFGSIVTAAQLPDNIGRRCETEKDHDIRAALVCLLTAAFVRTGNYSAIGDEVGGYFFLPPADLWAPWARNEIDRSSVSAAFS
jgi:predicted nuclease with RNAse H fold